MTHLEHVEPSYIAQSQFNNQCVINNEVAPSNYLFYEGRPALKVIELTYPFLPAIAA